MSGYSARYLEALKRKYGVVGKEFVSDDHDTSEQCFAVRYEDNIMDDNRLLESSEKIVHSRTRKAYDGEASNLYDTNLIDDSL